MRAVWNNALPLTDDKVATTYITERGLDPWRLEDENLVRVLPVGTDLPAWAAHWGSAERGYRLITRTFDADGQHVGLRARPPYRRDDMKALSAKGNWSGTVMANGLAQALLAGHDLDQGLPAADLVRDVGLVVAEGEIDYWAAATTWSDADDLAPAVIGIVAGSWSPEIACRIPSGTVLTMLVHDDKAGRKYGDEIRRSLAGRGVHFRKGTAP